MRVIITGGSGLIGRALTASLTDDGHEVVVLSRHPERVKNLPPNARVDYWDAKSADGWGHLADSTDAIINLAGASIAGESLIPARWTADRKRQIIESRVNAGKAVIEAINAATSKPKVIIQPSAVGYYGSRGDQIITEEAAAGSDFLAQVCIAWENAIYGIESSSVRVAIVRIGLVLSSDGGILPRLALPYKFFAGGPLGSGEQWYPWIHINDTVRAIRFLIERSDISGVFNITAPKPLKNKVLSQVLGRVLQRPSTIAFPAFALKLALGEMAMTALEGQRVVPERLDHANFTFQFTEAEAALHNLLAYERSKLQDKQQGQNHEPHSI